MGDFGLQNGLFCPLKWIALIVKMGDFEKGV